MGVCEIIAFIEIHIVAAALAIYVAIYTAPRP